jgi:hypothetical protein
MSRVKLELSSRPAPINEGVGGAGGSLVVLISHQADADGPLGKTQLTRETAAIHVPKSGGNQNDEKQLFCDFDLHRDYWHCRRIVICHE